MKRIPVAGPWITQLEIDAVADAAARAWYQDANLYHLRLEETFRGHTGMPFAVALPSCTSAIHLALMALGIGPGDEVIVPELTWIATAAPIQYVGATAVFADVDPETWCLDPGSLESWITPRTRAVIPVDLYGGFPDMDAICAIARRHGIAVIEDAAQAIGAAYRGRPAGSLGDFGVFSFHGSKTITAGEGGMLLCRDPERHRRALILRDHGREPGGRLFWNLEVGQKYKMSSLQAALAWAQMQRLPEILARKREAFGWYRKGLGGRTGLRLNAEPAGILNAYWMASVVLDPALGWDKERLGAALAERGIDTRPFFYPLSAMPAFEKHARTGEARERNRVAYALTPFGLNLPSSLSLTVDEADAVCAALLELLNLPAV
jgi:perosamine synthetase